jgi:hypothetical protein
MNEHAKAASAAPLKPLAPTAPKGVVNTDGKPAKAPKPPKEPKESNFKKMYPDAAVITVLAAANPKRPGSKAHSTFSLYKTGMAVGEFLKAGGYYAALSWDVGHRFVEVK